jgi:hypothetical protein
MPVELTWREPDRVSNGNGEHLTSRNLSASPPRCDVKRLSKWMSVPIGASTGRERDECPTQPGRRLTREEVDDVDFSREPFRRNLLGFARPGGNMAHETPFSVSQIASERHSRSGLRNSREDWHICLGRSTLDSSEEKADA